MESEIVKFMHHQVEVSSRKELVGKHRDYCLCWICKKFKPKDPENSCKMANLLFRVCVAFDITTPVFYCKEFEKEEVK